MQTMNVRAEINLHCHNNDGNDGNKQSLCTQQSTKTDMGY